jgi:3-oxoacyl-[acyl-carrier-protein] synthase II
MMAPGQPAVVISGIGAVSPFGVGRQRYWDAVSGGVSGIRAITQFDVSTYPCQVAAWVPPVSIADAVALAGDDDQDGRADPRRYSRAALFGVIAAREAWSDAGLRAGEPGAGVLIGSGGGGIDVGEKQYEDFFTAAGKHVTPYAIAVGICGMVSSEISISIGLRGMSHVLSCGCTSSTDAIGYAAALIRSGEYDAVLSGGTDGCVLPGMIFGFGRMRAVSTHYNDRPAAGVAATALAVRCGVLPPTINLDDPDPACEMDFIPNASRRAQIDAALCNCLGFGSKNSALVLGQPR